MYEWYIDESRGEVGYNFLGYPASAIFSPFLDTTNGITTPNWEVHSLTNLVGIPEDYYPKHYLYNPSNVASGLYTGQPTNVINLTDDLIGYGYALENIEAGSTGNVCMIVFDGGALQRIQEESAVVSGDIDNINGESI